MYSLLLLDVELTFLGLTVADWVALIGLVGGIGSVMIRLTRVMNNLDITVKQLMTSNERRDALLDQLSEHVNQHDKEFVKVETRLDELYDLKRGEFKYDKGKRTDEN